MNRKETAIGFIILLVFSLLNVMGTVSIRFDIDTLIKKVKATEQTAEVERAERALNAAYALELIGPLWTGEFSDPGIRFTDYWMAEAAEEAGLYVEKDVGRSEHQIKVVGNRAIVYLDGLELMQIVVKDRGSVYDNSKALFKAIRSKLAKTTSI